MDEVAELAPPERGRFGAALWGYQLIWRSHPILVLCTLGCTLLLGASPAGFAIAIRGLINEVTASLGDPGAGMDVALWWLALAFAITVADSLTGLLSQLLSDRLKSDLTLEVNAQVMEHAAGLDLPYIENTANRELLERVQQDPGIKLHLLFQHSQRAALSVFQVASLAAVLAWLEPAVILFAALVAVPFIISQWRLSRQRYMTNYMRSTKRRWTEYFLSRLITPAYAGDIKVLGIGGLLTRRFVAAMTLFRDQDRVLQQRQFTSGALFVTASTIAFYALFARVIMRTIEGDLSIGDLAIFGGAVVRMRSALETAIRAASNAYEQTLYTNDLYTFLQTRAMVEDRGSEGGREPRAIRGALSVQHVCFAYPGTREQILHDLTFEIEAGETVAIVGENGSGKSTLAKLLARLYDVDSGRIELDGRALPEYPLTSLRKEIALMAQSFGRYEASVAENIAYGDWDRLASDRGAVEEIARVTGIDYIAAGLPEGLDTKLGREFAEVDLSGGQWQLLAAARTMARRSSVLILDEPTSNIDARAEHALYAAIEEYAAEATTIIISHRFSTITMADRILVMDGGCIVEQGTHESLMQDNGHYARLYRLHEHYRADHAVE
ncbi:MAG: ABC transporter ATP-binding protein [Pseudomonadota bacterium]